MRKLRTGFTEYSPGDLASLGGKVGPAVAGIPIFAAITPTPAEVALQVKDLLAKMDAVGPGAKVALHASKAKLAQMLSTMARNLMATPNVTETELAETQFPLAKVRERTTSTPPAPGDLRLRHGAVSGQVLGSCRMSMANIRLLEVQWTLDPSVGPWIDAAPSTKTKSIVIDGLPRGKDIWVRIRARNVAGAGAWSDPATIMAI